MDRGRQWEFLIQAEVKSGSMIALPESVQSTVATDHLIKGPSICWNVEDEHRYVVLSEAPLERDAYTNVGFYTIYDVDDADDSGGRIRPPSDLDDVWAADPRPGERVFFLTHGAMRRSEKPSVYLLSETQVLDLLPSRAGEHAPSRDRAVDDSLFEVPGFDRTE